MKQDLAGMAFGRLIVECRADDYISPDGRHREMWKCRCECGNEKITRASSLLGGHTKSCGCYQSEINKTSTSKHGHYGERLYHVWVSMKQRCNNVKSAAYKNYGGRGIKVCEEWCSYNVFRDWAYNNGYDETAPRGQCTLDRIDVNEGYSPDNCKWTNMTGQANNRRTSVDIEYNGRVQSLSEWCREIGINYCTAWRRYKSGCSTEKIFFN